MLMVLWLLQIPQRAEVFLSHNMSPWVELGRDEQIVEQRTELGGDEQIVEQRIGPGGAGLGSLSPSEPKVFGSLEPEPLEEKTRSRSCLEKSQEPEPEPVKI